MELENLMDFPGVFTFRLVAAVSPGLEEACRALADGVLAQPVLRTEVRRSAGGKWTVIRLEARVECADEVRAVYAALKGVPGLQMLL